METNVQIYIPKIGERFKIEVVVKGKVSRHPVEVLEVTDQVERYLVKGKDRSITMQNDRPKYYSKGNYSRIHKWKLWRGEMRRLQTVEVIATCIDKYLEQKLRAFRGPKIHPKNEPDNLPTY